MRNEAQNEAERTEPERSGGRRAEMRRLYREVGGGGLSFGEFVIVWAEAERLVREGKEGSDDA